MSQLFLPGKMNHSSWLPAGSRPGVRDGVVGVGGGRSGPDGRFLCWVHMLCIRFQEQRLLDPFAASLDVIGTEAWKEDKKKILLMITSYLLLNVGIRYKSELSSLHPELSNWSIIPVDTQLGRLGLSCTEPWPHSYCTCLEWIETPNASQALSPHIRVQPPNAPVAGRGYIPAAVCQNLVESLERLEAILAAAFVTFSSQR